MAGRDVRFPFKSFIVKCPEYAKLIHYLIITNKNS